VTITSRWTGRDDAEEIAAALASWTGPVWTGQLQPGDIGWQLRFEEHELNATLLLVREHGQAVAVALVDAPGELRVAVDPARQDDVGLAGALVDELLAAPRTVPTSMDGSPVAAWRHRLAELGWSTGDGSYVAMHRSLRDIDPELPGGVRPVAGEADVTDRVLVQREAFERSTFTVGRWRLMAGSPMYDGNLDLLARDGEGRPVAAGTAWTAGRGRTGQLEPVGTHRDHQGQGHGRRLVLGLCSALASAGACAAAVETPVANAAAVRAYARAGFRTVALLTPMHPPSTTG
jgi:ribosomal protein S18 acetylase RimI-like enzyme